MESIIVKDMQIFNPTTARDRTDYITRMYRKINEDSSITPLTKIKGTPIEKLCRYDGPGYRRIKKWCEETLQKKEETQQTIYESGAPRDKRDHKLNYPSYFYPDFLVAYGKHMKKGEQYGEGSFKNGMPPMECFKSLFRHQMAIWMELEYGKESDEYKSFCQDQGLDSEEIHEAAVVFNVQQIWKWKDGRYEQKLKDNKKEND